ncbi:NAD(P)H-binding protein [Nonomuraea sp. NPDC049480]|uniref:NmrA family NAD(P)-binding protein n=1 Tax=Nonomuraea sp. NPDC049480 TaxID=3364353 RepID=UPI00378EC8C8
MNGLVMITGASGHLGGEVLGALLDRAPADRIAALARKPESLAEFAERGVSVRQGDYFDPAALETAFAGVDTLLLISAPAFTDLKAAHGNTIRAAQSAGVRHILYTAIQHRAGSDFTIPRVTECDAYTETELAASGLDVTVLRLPHYLDAFDEIMIGQVPPDGVIRVPAGHTPTALATRHDIAQAIAQILITDGHAGHDYTLSGSQTFTVDDFARILSEITGTAVTYQNIPMADYIQGLVATGYPEPAAEFLGAWFGANAAGEFTASDDIERLTGRPQIGLSDFLTARRSPSRS